MIYEYLQSKNEKSYSNLRKFYSKIFEYFSEKTRKSIFIKKIINNSKNFLEFLVFYYFSIVQKLIIKRMGGDLYGNDQDNCI